MNLKTKKPLSSLVICLGFLFPFLLYILLAILYAGIDPHAINFNENDQWYDIPRNENIIFHLSQNWTHYSFLDLAYYKHPPLFFYIGALAFRLGNETWLFLLMTLITMGTVLATYAFIKKLYGQKMAFATAFLLAFAPGLFDASYHVMFDVGVLLFYSLISLCIYKSFSENSKGLTILAGVIGGLMLLYKTSLAMIYPGCLIFLILAYRLKIISRSSFYFRIWQLIGMVIISLIIFLPWIIYLKLNHGGYPWVKEFFYRLPWQKDLRVSPLNFYFVEAFSRWGAFFCGLIVLGTIKFLYKLKNNRTQQDIFFMSLSCASLFFLNIWTMKSFRFLLPIFPFLIYLSILALQDISGWIIKRFNFPDRWHEKPVILFLAVVIAIFLAKNTFLFTDIPQPSPYKIAADYIKANGLTSDCYLSDERIIFENYIQKSTFWEQPDLAYNINGIIGNNITLAVVSPSNAKFIPVVKQIKLFEANKKTVGIYLINTGLLETLKNENKQVEILIIDKNNDPIPAVFISLYADHKYIFNGRTNAAGKVTLLSFGKKHLTLKIKAWGRKPVRQELDIKDGLRVTVRMKDAPFMINGLSSMSTF